MRIELHRQLRKGMTLVCDVGGLAAVHQGQMGKTRVCAVGALAAAVACDVAVGWRQAKKKLWGSSCIVVVLTEVMEACWSSLTMTWFGECGVQRDCSAGRME
jgi:hypothetical protein